MMNTQKKPANKVEKLVASIKKTNIGHWGAVTLMLACALLIVGHALEFNYEIALLTDGGQTALENYHLYMKFISGDSITGLMNAGISGKLPSVGATMKAIGIAIALIVMPVCTITLAAAKQMMDIANRYPQFARYAA
jgi:hypothetical protein